MAKIQDFVLLKSAELALANNATHFTLAGSADATRRSYITTPTTHNTTVSSYGRHSGAYQRNIGGGTYDGIYSGSARINTTTNHGSIIPVIKPGMDVFVTIFKIPTNRTPRPNMINAQGIYNSIAPRLIK